MQENTAPRQSRNNRKNPVVASAINSVETSPVEIVSTEIVDAGESPLELPTEDASPVDGGEQPAESFIVESPENQVNTIRVVISAKGHNPGIYTATECDECDGVKLYAVQGAGVPYVGVPTTNKSHRGIVAIGSGYYVVSPQADGTHHAISVRIAELANAFTAATADAPAVQVAKGSLAAAKAAIAEGKVKVRKAGFIFVSAQQNPGGR